MNRTEVILKYVDKQKTGIEIGPSYNPLCPKREGWNVYVVDHASRQELVRKYEALLAADPEHASLDVDRIEEVDLIWRGGSIADLCREAGVEGVDFIVASHVIEHAPCLISFLRSLEELLAEDGVISMAVPDKRREFDLFKPLSSTADVMEAYREKRTRHTARTAFLTFFYDCTFRSNIAWSGTAELSEIAFMHDFEEAAKSFASLRSDNPEEYNDFHAWFFTPSSLELILLELRALGHVNLVCFEVEGPVGFEFYVHMRRGGDRSELTPELLVQKRKELLKKIHDEICEPHAPLPGPVSARQRWIDRLKSLLPR